MSETAGKVTCETSPAQIPMATISPENSSVIIYTQRLANDSEIAELRAENAEMKGDIAHLTTLVGDLRALVLAMGTARGRTSDACVGTDDGPGSAELGRKINAMADPQFDALIGAVLDPQVGRVLTLLQDGQIMERLGAMFAPEISERIGQIMNPELDTQIARVMDRSFANALNIIFSPVLNERLKTLESAELMAKMAKIDDLLTDVQKIKDESAKPEWVFDEITYTPGFSNINHLMHFKCPPYSEFTKNIQKINLAYDELLGYLKQDSEYIVAFIPIESAGLSVSNVDPSFYGGAFVWYITNYGRVYETFLDMGMNFGHVYHWDYLTAGSKEPEFDPSKFQELDWSEGGKPLCDAAILQLWNFAVKIFGNRYAWLEQFRTSLNYHKSPLKLINVTKPVFHRDPGKLPPLEWKEIKGILRGGASYFPMFDAKINTSTPKYEPTDWDLLSGAKVKRFLLSQRG